MKHALLAVMAIGTAVVANNATADTPHHSRHPGVHVLLRHSERQLVISNGENQLDGPKTITCESPTGCLISFKANVWFVTAPLRHVCVQALLDGQKVLPRCPSMVPMSGYFPSLQSALATPGKHVVQTVVFSSGTEAGTVQAWEVDYVIYPKEPHDN